MSSDPHIHDSVDVRDFYLLIPLGNKEDEPNQFRLDCQISILI